MKMILFLNLIIIVISTINGQFGNIPQQRTSPMMFRDNPPIMNDNRFGNIPHQRTLPMMFRDNPPIGNENQFGLQSTFRIPFPQCLTTDISSKLLNPSTLQNIFDIKLQDEDRKLKHERLRNDDMNNSMNKLIN
jgi:hypothetical protein